MSYKNIGVADYLQIHGKKIYLRIDKSYITHLGKKELINLYPLIENAELGEVYDYLAAANDLKEVLYKGLLRQEYNSRGQKVKHLNAFRAKYIKKIAHLLSEETIYYLIKESINLDDALTREFDILAETLDIMGYYYTLKQLILLDISIFRNFSESFMFNILDNMTFISKIAHSIDNNTIRNSHIISKIAYWAMRKNRIDIIQLLYDINYSLVYGYPFQLFNPEFKYGVTLSELPSDIYNAYDVLRFLHENKEENMKGWGIAVTQIPDLLEQLYLEKTYIPGCIAQRLDI